MRPTRTSARARRLATAGALSLTAGALLAAGAGTAVAAGPSPDPSAAGAGGAAYGGFTTSATATPLRIEVHEPAIPVPADPQVELNFSYTTVSGSSGPDSTALASAMWPGNAVGNGLPTILVNVGLPANLLGNGYPVRVDAQYPGSPSSGSQEFLPGMVGRVSGTATRTVARSGYSTSGQVAGDGASGNSLPSVLDQLKSGDLGALGGLLSGPNSDSDTGSNPLGLLSALISVGGMSSSSVTDYGDASTVTATATSQLGEIDLLGGLVKLDGVTVASTSSSSVDGGGKATQKVTYGGLSIAGVPFALTSDGVEASGKTMPIPGLPDAPMKALEKLGISIDLPKPTRTTDGTEVSAQAAGPTITIDTKPVISLLQLDKLPLTSLLDKLPSSANQLKGVLLGVLQAHPKLVVKLGDVSTTAQTIAPIGTGGGPSGPGGPAGGSTGSGSSTSSGGTPGTGSSVDSPPSSTTPPPDSTPPSASPPLKATSAVPGLPPLGSVPVLLTLAGLIVAGGAAWFFRSAALSALGGAGTCSHGLASGLPDLRKA